MNPKLVAAVLAGCFALAAAHAQTPPPSQPAAKPPGHPAMPPVGTAAQPAPHGAGTRAPDMGVSPSTAQRIVWTCQAGALGNVPIMVNFVDKTALSTRAAAISPAKIDGDKVRWQETEPDGTLKYVLDRKSGEIQITQTPKKGKEIVHTGRCGPPTGKAGKAHP
jgi:hypothetical protein